MKITAPGNYDIEIEAYHHDANLCAGPSISASALNEIDDCPAKYWATSPYNPNRFEPEETKVFIVGRAAHALVLGEPEFARYFFVAPHDRFNANPGKQWYDAWKVEVEAKREKRSLLKPDEFETVAAMAKAQRASPFVMQAFERGRPERSLIWKDAETGIWLKARPDWLPDDCSQRFVVDYKSADTIEPRKLSSDAFKFRYHVQAALQMDAVRIVLGVKRPLGIAHVVQEKKPPYLADLRMFQPEQLDLGRMLYRRALRTFADCLSSGKWPGYTTDPQYFETPVWVAKQIEELNDDDDGNDGSARQRHNAAEYYAAG